jgi:hypothetical protein
VLVSRRLILPEITKTILRPRFEQLEVEYKQMLDTFAKCIREELEAPVLDLVGHYQSIGEALEECRRLIGTLKIHRYWGHCGL